MRSSPPDDDAEQGDLFGPNVDGSAEPPHCPTSRNCQTVAAASNT
jgi:hypothetical protein